MASAVHPELDALCDSHNARPENPMRADVQVNGSTMIGMFTFDLLTRKARTWARQNVARGAFNGAADSFACDDTRRAMDIASGMQANGLIVK